MFCFDKYRKGILAKQSKTRKGKAGGACDRLNVTEVKAIKCELWRENGGALNRQIHRDLTGKTKCITTNDFGEMLTIKGSKGIPIQCDPKEQKSFLQEVNSICDALLSQKASN